MWPAAADREARFELVDSAVLSSDDKKAKALAKDLRRHWPRSGPSCTPTASSRPQQRRAHAATGRALAQGLVRHAERRRQPLRRAHAYGYPHRQAARHPHRRMPRTRLRLAHSRPRPSALPRGIILVRPRRVVDLVSRAGTPTQERLRLVHPRPRPSTLPRSLILRRPGVSPVTSAGLAGYHGLIHASRITPSIVPAKSPESCVDGSRKRIIF